MDPALIDTLYTFGLLSLVLAVTAVGIGALPWRSQDLRASVDAWSHLSELSGGMARSGVAGLRVAAERVWDLGARRPSAVMTRTLS
ncbi:MAG: hypothetical protein EA397_03945 [Deltaproteobacteria bacterium]|nr:MAG: hypothetical protein EA397_03945 [Deltaproteobacteria bacterium]